VTVNIPYGSTPSEHAQRLYKKAKKLKRSIATLDGLLAKVRLWAPCPPHIDTPLPLFDG
jgi:hypothetical protein